MKLSDFLHDVGRPVAYYPKLRRVSGSTTATIFLCQFVYWIGKESRGDKYIEKSVKEIEDETGLSYKEQLTARKELVKRGLLQERYSRLDHKLIFRVNKDALNTAWESESNEPEDADELTISDIPENGHITNEQMGKLPTSRSYNGIAETTNIEAEESITNVIDAVSQAQPLSLQDEIFALNGNSPANSSRTEKRERKPRSPKVTSVSPGDANNYHREMFAALASLCVVDVKLKSGQLGKAAKQLREAGYTPADLDKFKAWWYSQDWRGKNGQPPAINVVSELILQALSWVPQPAHPQPVQVAKPKGYDLSTLRSWHKQHYYEEWNYRVAAELGISPTMPGAFKEWYDSEASIPDDQLADWYEQYLADSKEKQQW